MNHTDVVTRETRRNAPSAAAALSGCVDALQHAVDEAGAAGLHGIAAELDAHRDAVAGLALRLWGVGKGATR